jgi:hypothetical protein
MESPDVYLGATIARMTLADGKTCWTMSPELYVKAAVATALNKHATLATVGAELRH